MIVAVPFWYRHRLPFQHGFYSFAVQPFGTPFDLVDTFQLAPGTQAYSGPGGSQRLAPGNSSVSAHFRQN
jgi:hypothetical protein